MRVQTNSVRNSQSPLTTEQLQHYVPSAFAVTPYHKMSDRYGFIPTSEVIEGMRSAGFLPFAASQSRTSIEDKRGFTKHVIRFRTPEMAHQAVGATFPEVVLINSHDGGSAYKLMAGLFRLVCGNGLIIADAMIASVSLRHSHNIIEQAALSSAQLVRQLPAATDALARWSAIQLTQDEQGVFAESAHRLRFADSDGHVTTPIQPATLLRARRYEDNKSDLWSTFNRIQENVVKGGLRGYASNGRRITTKAVTSIDTDTRLNRELWALAERMAELKAGNA